VAINLSDAENEFNHKIYELKGTKFFTSLTQLSIFNEELSVDYLTEVAEVIQANIREK
jgi:hypothetical protein